MTAFFKTHLGLVLSMICITLLWSSAGVISRQMTAAQGWELTFWRSAFTAVFVAAYWLYSRRWLGVKADVSAGVWFWVSALCWAIMFTCFMLAMSFTSVGHVLLTMSVGPLLTAVFARLFFKQTIAHYTWLAALCVGAGLAYMFGADLFGTRSGASLEQAAANHSRAVSGMLIAFCVPIAGAFNFVVLQHAAKQRLNINLMPAVCVGAVLSSLACLAIIGLVMAQPLLATTKDLAWLAALGLFQLAIPCVWVVWVSARLPAAEVSLLQILEIIFGTTWAWLWANETPSSATLWGGSFVVAVLLANAAWGLQLNRNPKS